MLADVVTWVVAVESFDEPGLAPLTPPQPVVAIAASANTTRSTQVQRPRWLLLHVKTTGSRRIGSNNPLLLSPLWFPVITTVI